MKLESILAIVIGGFGFVSVLGSWLDSGTGMKNYSIGLTIYFLVIISLFFCGFIIYKGIPRDSARFISSLFRLVLVILLLVCVGSWSIYSFVSNVFIDPFEVVNTRVGKIYSWISQSVLVYIAIMSVVGSWIGLVQLKNVRRLTSRLWTPPALQARTECFNGMTTADIYSAYELRR